MKGLHFYGARGKLKKSHVERDLMPDKNLTEDEVLSSARFGITEMEDVLGDTLDEMDNNDEW